MTARQLELVRSVTNMPKGSPHCAKGARCGHGPRSLFAPTLVAPKNPSAHGAYEHVSAEMIKAFIRATAMFEEAMKPSPGPREWQPEQVQHGNTLCNGRPNDGQDSMKKGTDKQWLLGWRKEICAVLYSLKASIGGSAAEWRKNRDDSSEFRGVPFGTSRISREA